jgi:hypothetical protein
MAQTKFARNLPDGISYGLFDLFGGGLDHIDARAWHL